MTSFSPRHLIQIRAERPFSDGRPSAHSTDDTGSRTRSRLLELNNVWMLWIALGGVAQRRPGWRVKPLLEVRREIAWARAHLGDVKRVVLADDRALRAPPAYLDAVLTALTEELRSLRRIEIAAPPERRCGVQLWEPDRLDRGAARSIQRCG